MLFRSGLSGLQPLPLKMNRMKECEKFGGLFQRGESPGHPEMARAHLDIQNRQPIVRPQIPKFRDVLRWLPVRDSRIIPSTIDQ